MGRFYFNPHEREARDETYSRNGIGKVILIHTSVKLVTRKVICRCVARLYFNPHEREARDHYKSDNVREIIILIHTSVKLVT